MLVHLESGADAGTVGQALAGLGLWTRRFDDDGGRTSFLVERHSAQVCLAAIRNVPGISSVAIQRSGTPRLDRQPSAFEIAGVAIGVGAPPLIAAGPCSVESEASIRRLAGRVAEAGARFLRGGAFKPRTSPYSFEGHGIRALGWLRRAADEHGLAVVTEATSEAEVGPVAEVADLVQVGSRNMHDAALLAAIGRTGRPVLLKRGMAATIEEWLLAAERCLLAGAAAVVPCERGVRSFDPTTRNVLDIGAVAYLTGSRGIPVLVDPSHAAGRRDLIAPLARAALAAGAAGLLIEVHDAPAESLSDGPQAISPDTLRHLHPETQAPGRPAGRGIS